MAANKKNQDGKQSQESQDRLSSLPDNILIDVLSRLPLCSAIINCSLSRRWQCLWTNVTSIHLIRRYLDESDADFTTVLSQITSPSIHSFTLEFINPFPNRFRHTSTFEWLQNICDRNVRELKLTVPDGYTLPCLIFETQSLVSIDLEIWFWVLPKNDYTINLPNLKNLRLRCALCNPECLEKLIAACPSLEEFSLSCGLWGSKKNIYLRLSNQNLRRLSLTLYHDFREVQIVISAPKLEYFHLHAPNSDLISFDEKPILLHQANIEITSKESKSDSEFYKDICNVKVLSLDVSDLSNLSSSFPNATRVTLNMKTCHNIHIVLSFLRRCDVLDVLTLKFFDIGLNDEKYSSLLKPGKVKTLLRVIKRIEIQTYWTNNVNPTKSFIELVEYLLSEAKGLEHFRVRIIDDEDGEKVNGSCIATSEEKLCKLLYQCPTVSKECDVEFMGKLFTMSRKAGPKIYRANGKSTRFRCSPWNGFEF